MQTRHAPRVWGGGGHLFVWYSWRVDEGGGGGGGHQQPGGMRCEAPLQGAAEARGLPPTAAATLAPRPCPQKFPQRFYGVYTKLKIFNLTQYERGAAGAPRLAARSAPPTALLACRMQIAHSAGAAPRSSCPPTHCHHPF
jgi:hypothetical protein